MNRAFKWIGVLLLVAVVLLAAVTVMAQAAQATRTNQSHPDYIENLPRHTTAYADNIGAISDALPTQWT